MLFRDRMLSAKSLLALVALVCTGPLCRGQNIPNQLRTITPQLGATGSAYTLDYGEGHEEGFSIYADLDTQHLFGIEAAYRNASIITPHDVGEDAYLIGPRIFVTRGRFSPYARMLFGIGVINFQQGYNAFAYSNSYGMFAPGGGIDLKASRHITLRLIDFEYQRWFSYPPHGLTPWGFSAGAAYTF